MALAGASDWHLLAQSNHAARSRLGVRLLGARACSSGKPGCSRLYVVPQQAGLV